MTEQGPVPDENYILAGHSADIPIPEYDKSILKDWVLFNHSLTAAVGPWGVSFSANITSDGTGLGNWTYDQFKTAITKGLYKGFISKDSIFSKDAIFIFIYSVIPTKSNINEYCSAVRL